MLGATISVKHSEISLVILGKFETNLNIYTYTLARKFEATFHFRMKSIFFFLEDANIVITGTINYVDVRN